MYNHRTLIRATLHTIVDKGPRRNVRQLASRLLSSGDQLSHSLEPLIWKRLSTGLLDRSTLQSLKALRSPYATPGRLGSRIAYKSFCLENRKKVQAELIYSEYSRPAFVVEVSRRSPDNI